MGKLTVKAMQSIVKKAVPGRYSDGQGLYFMIPPIGVPYWILRYTLHGKRRALTLGKHTDLSLAQVRGKAEEIKEKVRQDDDPITERKRLRRPKIKTVDDLFNDWYQDLQRRLKHPSIPNRIFKKDISPYVGDLALNKVTPLDIRSIIQQITTSNRPTIANDALMYLK